MPPFLRWLLQLGPMNPIAVRLVHNGSRRQRHFYIRATYLADGNGLRRLYFPRGLRAVSELAIGDYTGDTRDVIASTEGQLEWVHPGSLGALDLVEDLTTIIPRALAQDDSEAPFSARYHYDDQGRLIIQFDD